jgi:rhodanese-related sulfurtransferase
MPDVVFDVANGYGGGQETAVAVNRDDLVLEVHREKTNELHLRFGRAAGTYVAWQGASSPQYGTGTNPKIAVNKSMVVEVHQKPGAHAMAYSLGSISGNNFTFGTPRGYVGGTSPAVAISSDNVVIGIEEDGASTHVISYRLGVAAKDGTLTGWANNPGQQPIPGARGILPSIAVNGDGTVIAIFQSPTTGAASTVVGTLNGKKGIDWGTVQAYDTAAASPSIALTNDGLAIAAALAPKVPKSKDLFVVCRTGQVNRQAKTVQWKAGAARVCNYISMGSDLSKPVTAVSVATNGYLGIEAYATNGAMLGYSGSLVLDRSRWMQNSLPQLGAKTLKQIVFPASHDAATNVIRDCSFLGGECAAKTQINTIYDQLRSGSRYFDIRPVYYKKALETGHFGSIKDIRNNAPFITLASPITGIVLATLSDNQGCDGAHLAPVLADVARFMKTGVKEVVILKFSHYYDRDKDVTQFDKTVMTLLVNAVRTALKDYLYVRPAGSRRLANTPLNKLIGNRGIVLPVFDLKDGAQVVLGDGLYSYLDFDPAKPLAGQLAKADLVVYDDFANTDSLTTLETNQKAKLQTAANRQADLFLYSWTLTLSDLTSFFCAFSLSGSTTLGLASMAGSALQESVSRLHRNGVITDSVVPNVLYLDSVSGFCADTAVWLDQRLLIGDTLSGDQRGYLRAGDSLVSASGTYRLTYQPDGDLVLYKGTARVKSLSSTKGKATWRCIMQDNGNFVVYSAPYTSVFESGTGGNPGARITLKDSGKLVITDRKGNKIASAKLDS